MVFFAVISTVTPPVALAAFAAAPIAGAPPFQTGLQAARLSLAGFIIPFVFVYHPAVIYKLQTIFVLFGEEMPQSRAMIDIASVSWIDLSWIVIAFIVSMWLLTSALTGMEKYLLTPGERIVRAVMGLFLLVPSILISGVALLCGIILIFLHRMPRLNRAAGS